MPPGVNRDVPLAPRTTLGVGGAAHYHARVEDPASLGPLLAWARDHHLPTFVLGGGSNLLVADTGFDGLCLEFVDERLTLEDLGSHVRVRAGAGVPWDHLVATAVDAGLGGLECLSGIPGRVGAAPIQNVGAYGQEVAETLESVDVVERSTGAVRRLAADQCGFAYRWSHFKGPWKDRYVVTALHMLLPRRDHGTVRYGDLQRRFGVVEGGAMPSLTEVRGAVLDVRRSKSMVLDPDDPNRRSAGSFFVNPVLSASELATVVDRCRALGIDPDTLPRYPTADGDRDEGKQTKLPAAWLIERAGFNKGHRLGRAGLSTRHTLALINRGGASAAEIVDLARQIRDGVLQTFGVTLRPEPVFLGFDEDFR